MLTITWLMSNYCIYSNRIKMVTSQKSGVWGFVVRYPAGKISDPQGGRAAHQCTQAVHAAGRVDGPLHRHSGCEVPSGRWRNDVTMRLFRFQSAVPRFPRPVQLLTAVPDLVTIAFQNQRPGVKSQAFLDDQAIAPEETALAGYSDHARATTSHYQRRGYNRWKLLRQAVDKFFVITQRLERVHGAPPVRSL